MMAVEVIMLIIVTVFGIYGVRYILKEKQKERAKLALALAYERLVMKHKLTIEHSEVLGNRIIALDRKNKMLLYVYHTATYKQEEVIPLLRLAASKVVEESDGQKGYVSSVYLDLGMKAGDDGHRLNFYQSQKDRSTELLPAMQRARNWKQRVDVNKDPGVVSLEAEYVESREENFELREMSNE